MYCCRFCCEDQESSDLKRDRCDWGRRNLRALLYRVGMSPSAFVQVLTVSILTMDENGLRTALQNIFTGLLAKPRDDHPRPCGKEWGAVFRIEVIIKEIWQDEPVGNYLFCESHDSYFSSSLDVSVPSSPGI